MSTETTLILCRRLQPIDKFLSDLDFPLENVTMPPYEEVYMTQEDLDKLIITR